MLEKTFTMFHASNVLLQQQYREPKFTKYFELISYFLILSHYCSTSDGAVRLSFSENLMSYYHKNHGIEDFFHNQDHVLILVHVHEFETILHSLQRMIQIQLDETSDFSSKVLFIYLFLNLHGDIDEGKSVFLVNLAGMLDFLL